MRLDIGNKIRELRYRDSRTQEELAYALEITPQAVSRWENDGSYPDMEMIPSIANYFGITIDELFGYQNDREMKVDAIIEKVNNYEIRDRGDDEWVDECLSILREGLAEFPQNERLLITLAEMLTEAGWRRYREWAYYDDEGFLQHQKDIHTKNEYWLESEKICQNLVGKANDNSVITKALNILVVLNRNFGDYEKVREYAEKMPELKDCREILLSYASDGKDEARYTGELLLKMAREFSRQLVYALITNKKNFESDMPIEKIKGAIRIFELICDDGNFGKYHYDLAELYLYLSRIQWERDYRDDAFVSLDDALNHACKLDEFCNEQEYTFTAPLVSFVKFKGGEHKQVAKSLAEDWPVWCNPDCTQVAREIKADPRWNEWVEKTKI